MARPRPEIYWRLSTGLKTNTSVPPVVVGFSFGAAMALSACCGRRPVRALAALGLPTHAEGHDYRYRFLADCNLPKLFLSGDRDQYAPAAQLAQVAASASEPKRLVLLPGADHFFAGQLEPMQTSARRLAEGASANDSGQRFRSRCSARHGHRNLYRRDSRPATLQSAFDRRIRFEGNTLHRLLPDGSGPATIDLSRYKRIFVIALGKAAGPMLDTLLDRMKRRKGLRGICCSNQLPKTRNWRFRYFEGGHPLPNEESFAAARAALAMLKRAKKDTLIFFLISGGGSAMFDLPLDPQIALEDTIAFHQLLLASGAPINEINTLRKHFSAVKGGRLAMAAPEAAKVSLLLPDVPLRSLDALSSGPTSPDHSTVADVRAILHKVRPGAQAAALDPRLL